MTAHRQPLPSQADVRAAIDALTDEAGRTPSVLALANRLGLANTTFRRNFPDVCARLTQPRPATGAVANAFTALKTENARLRRDKRDLAQQLDLAIAAIQRLSIDNDRLRTALHEASSITRLAPRPR
jgi:AraC-like DNA-binding protein